MGLETGNFIDDLVDTNPVSSTDLVRYGAAHIRLIKDVLQNSFAGSTGAIIAAGLDIGTVNAIAVAPATPLLEYTTRMMIVWLQGVTNTGAVTINVSGLGAKSVVSVANAALVSGDLVAGRVYVGIYDGSSVQLAAVTKNYVDQLAFLAALPAQATNGGKVVTTDGTAASWTSKLLAGTMRFADSSDQTKQLAFNISGYSSGATRTITLPDRDLTLGNISSSMSVSTDTTLTSASAGYISASMSSIGKSITEAAATTLIVGGPVRIVKNDGGFPVAYRDSTGTLLTSIAPGGVLYATLKDNSTSAGVWSVAGNNLEAAIVTIDNVFSSTYPPTVLAPYVALDDNTSIHFAALSSGFAAFVVDNVGKVLTTPVTVAATGFVFTAFKVSSTSAIVFYTGTNGSAVVLTLSGSTPSYTLTVGTPVDAAFSTVGFEGENFINEPKIAQLTSTLYLFAKPTASPTNSLRAFAISVSGATVTMGSTATLSVTNAVASCATVYALTATTGLVVYKSGSTAPYTNNAVVISVSGTTCTFGTPASLTGVQSTGASTPSSCLLSATKCLVMDDNNAAGAVIVNCFTISGTTVTAETALSVETGITNSSFYTSNNASRYNPHLFALTSSTSLLWYLDNLGESRSVVLTESAGTLSAGIILARAISSGISAAAGYGAILPQGTSEFCSLISQLDSTNSHAPVLTTCKISGTTLTQGYSINLRAPLPCAIPVTLSVTRMSTGKYVLIPSAGIAQAALFVWASNGTFVTDYGTASMPPLGLGSTTSVPRKVSSNRVVVIGSVPTGGAVSATSLRLLNVEIAA